MSPGINLFITEARAISSQFPDLSWIEKGGKVIVSGELELKDEAGLSVDSYKIEIHPSENYPNQFPFVFETGGRIPINIDWHVYEGDGHCCLTSPPEELLKCKKGINLIPFVKEEVIPYFFNQHHRERYGYFLQERPHTIFGQLGYFFELFQTNDIVELFQLMKFSRNGIEPSRSEVCFCSSRRKYRHCHRDAFRKMRQFKDQEIDVFIGQLLNSREFRITSLLNNLFYPYVK